MTCSAICSAQEESKCYMSALDEANITCDIGVFEAGWTANYTTDSDESIEVVLDTQKFNHILLIGGKNTDGVGGGAISDVRGFDQVSQTLSLNATSDHLLS